MLYFIKSPKWTKNDKVTTYWCPNQSGYTTLLGDAGVYTQEEIDEICKRVSKDGAQPIPITDKLIKKALKQCETKDENIKNNLLRAQELYFNALKELEKEKEKNKVRKNNIEKLTKQINE